MRAGDFREETNSPFRRAGSRERFVAAAESGGVVLKPESFDSGGFTGGIGENALDDDLIGIEWVGRAWQTADGEFGDFPLSGGVFRGDVDGRRERLGANGKYGNETQER